jgi:hypothetical protein
LRRFSHSTKNMELLCPLNNGDTIVRLATSF